MFSIGILTTSQHAVSAQHVEPPITRLSVTAARNGQGFWAPNGREISFVSNRSGSWQIWLASATGAEPRQITRARGPVGWPSWAPNGSEILYYERTEAGHRLFTVRIGDGRVEPVFHEPYQDFRPLLSPDGARLLFDRFGYEQPANHDLFVRNLRDGTVRQLTRDPGYDSDARWSPDGQRIVWHSDRGMETRYRTQIYSSNADGSDIRQLTSGEGIAGYPTWAPDGRWIAYTVEVEGNRDIWIMQADGTDPRRLTNHPGFDGDPAWSPASDQLLFTTGRFGGQELAILDLTVRQSTPGTRVLDNERRGRTSTSTSRVCAADSKFVVQHCASGDIALLRGSVAETLARSPVELPGNPIAVPLGQVGHARPFGQVLPEPAVGVLIGPALPGVMRCREIEARGNPTLEGRVAVELRAVVHRERADAPGLGADQPLGAVVHVGPRSVVAACRAKPAPLAS